MTRYQVCARHQLFQNSAIICVIVVVLEFLESFIDWHSKSKLLATETSSRFAELQHRRTEMSFTKLANDFCEKEKSHNTKLDTDFTYENVRISGVFLSFLIALC
jgi:hypothetical protein